MKSHKTVNSEFATMKTQISRHTCSVSSVLLFLHYYVAFHCIPRYSRVLHFKYTFYSALATHFEPLKAWCVSKSCMLKKCVHTLQTYALSGEAIFRYSL